MSEFHRAVGAFEAAAHRTEATCAGIAEDAWNAHPRQGFSIGEIVEHMALSNRLFGRRLDVIFKTPPGEEPYSALEDAEVPHLFERAAEPPGLAEPTGTWTDPKAAIRMFAESAAPIAALAVVETGDLRSRGAPHPLFGPMDGVQWALFAAAHTERHRSEIIGLLARIGR